MKGNESMNMQQMMKQARKMQAQLAEVQEQVAQEEITSTAGGGMVSVRITGGLEIKEIVIDPDAVDPDDVEMLQDTVTAAVNEAIRAAQGMAEERMGAVTGGLNIPGIM